MTRKSQAKTAAYYDAIAAGYSELHGEEQRAKYRIIAQALNLPKTAKVLDVGAGTGVGNEFFSDMIGIDPSNELIAQHPHQQSTVGHAEKLPYADSSFDAVLCVTAIHHTRYRQALAEMQRVSRGSIAVTVLKKSPKAKEICGYIKKQLHPLAVVNEQKDWIFVKKQK